MHGIEGKGSHFQDDLIFDDEIVVVIHGGCITDIGQGKFDKSIADAFRVNSNNGADGGIGIAGVVECGESFYTKGLTKKKGIAFGFDHQINVQSFEYIQITKRIKEGIAIGP